MEGTGSRPLLELLESAREGSGDDLEVLLRRLRPRVERYLVDRLQSHPSTDAIAEELTQETLVRVARSIGDCRARTEGELYSWVRTTARRIAVDRYRRRERELQQRLWEDGRVDGRLLLETVVDEDTDPESPEVLEADDVLGRLLWEALAELTDGTQQVLRRRLLYGETWRQVGEVVGTTAAGAKRRFQRAQDRLRKEVVGRVDELPDDLRRKVLRRWGAILSGQRPSTSG